MNSTMPVAIMTAAKTTIPLVFILLCAGACTIVPLVPSAPAYSVPEFVDCLALFERNDELIDHGRVGDAENARVGGFPFLRTNRFLSSLRDNLSTPAARTAWIDHLSALDGVGRRIEVGNLHPSMRPADSEIEALERCVAVLKRHVLADPASFDAVRRRAIVPDSYTGWARVLGFYPLTSLIVLNGVSRLQRREGAYFVRDPDAFDNSEERIAYGLTSKRVHKNIYNIINQAPRDALGIPLIDPAGLKALFDHFSPVWSIASHTQNDRIGTVRRNGQGVTIDTALATVYTRVSYTKFAGEVLVQLNYTVWFPARPKRGAFDLLGGTIDGITWRATLDSGGQLLAADAMHNCGCYYMAFPTPRIRARNRSGHFEEPLWIPTTLSLDDDARVVIFISRDAHYIRKIATTRYPAVQIQLVSSAYDELRSLPQGHQQRRSLFEPNGLVIGSERGERWFLWPMGIVSAGAMRQFGHHAIAFVGRRHFDDPDLLEAYFEPAGTDDAP